MKELQNIRKVRDGHPYGHRSYRHFFNLRADLSLMPPEDLPKDLLREMISTLRKIEVLFIKRYEQALREELAVEIREMRSLTLREQAISYFSGARYSVAILLLREEN